MQNPLGALGNAGNNWQQVSYFPQVSSPTSTNSTPSSSPNLLFRHGGVNPVVQVIYESLKRKIEALSPRDPQRLKNKLELKRMRLETPNLEPILFIERVSEVGVEKEVEEVKKNLETETTNEKRLQTLITIGNGEEKREFSITEEQKALLISLSPLFENLLCSAFVKSDTSAIDLGTLNCDLNALCELLQLAISGKDIKYDFNSAHTLKLYDAAFALQMDKYKQQVKDWSLQVCGMVASKKARLAKFRLIAEQMQPHSQKDLAKLYEIGLQHESLPKMLSLRNQIQYPPDMDFMLKFMDQHREEHKTDQYNFEFDIYGDKKERNALLSTVSFWMPDLKKLQLKIHYSQEIPDLADVINFDIGFFAQLTELSMKGVYEFANVAEVIKEFCPKLERLSCHYAYSAQVLDQVTEMPNLKEVNLKGSIYRREDVSQPFKFVINK